MRTRIRHIRAASVILAGVLGLSCSIGTGVPTSAREQKSTTATPRKKDDPTPLSPIERLRVQRLVTRKARATHEIARLQVEVAEIAIEEYRDGTYADELATVEGEIKLAKSNLILAEDRLAWAERMRKKGFLLKPASVSAELDLERAHYQLEQAQSKKKVLTDYTHEKTLGELKAQLEKAQRDEGNRRADWIRQENRLAEMLRVFDGT